MKVLYAIRKDEPEYMEEIITTNEDVIVPATKWAQDNGFDRLRIAEYSDIPEKPDFTKVLNTRR
jgi:glycosyltransferase A (GT-A) superfamily protein (DUF2064 family)